MCFRVDYVDTFGRSRRCLRKDLPELERMDRKLQQSNRCVHVRACGRIRALVQVRASDEVLATYMYTCACTYMCLTPHQTCDLRSLGDSGDEQPSMTMPKTAAYREQVRLKWEEEARRDMADPDAPTHYANVQFDGTRASVYVSVMTHMTSCLFPCVLSGGFALFFSKPNIV